ncbi:hypothetical protein ACN9MG_32410 [Burkholderia ambifaria]|jgi:hypothetical protein|uniref:hypothetical protein n=1 Tax=Burkholderia TaxID=32008 RepID=UPI00158EB259|nr:hypothetical protein [Burkholderia ambifaria]
MPCSTPNPSKFAEVIFGGLAKGTLVVAAIIVAILAVLSGDASGLTDLPTTRKQWLYFLLVVLLVLMGFICFIAVKRFGATGRLY